MDESELERAKENEIAERKQGIKEVLDRPDHGVGESQLMINDQVCCIDCYDPIPQQRLEIRPNAVRCVECKEIWEKKHGR